MNFAGPTKKAPDLPVFHGGGGLQLGIDPYSNKSMSDAADDQEIVANQRLREESTANLMLAIESATLTIQAPCSSQEPASQKTLREDLYVEGFRAKHPKI